MHVVTDSTGKIIAAAHAGSSHAGDSPGMHVELRALEGQKIHDVAVPEKLLALHPHERLRAMLEHAVYASGTSVEAINETRKE
jgi:hypothetical protein